MAENKTHTRTSKVFSERSLRYLINLNFPSPTLAEVLITPLQCNECHPLLGGVLYLGLLPDSFGSAVTCCVLIALPIVSLSLSDADTSPSCLPLGVEQTPHCTVPPLYVPSVLQASMT